MKLPLVLVAGLSLLFPQPRPRPVAHPDYGVVTSVQFLDGVSLLRLQDLGVGTVRVVVGWNLVEATKGRFELDRIQEWIDQAHEQGLKIYVTLGDPPPWAAPCAACMPYNLWDWYDYVHQVVARFSYLGGDITFGIWNEPNLGQFLNPPLPDLYGDLFDYADMARQDANPAARLAGPETEQGAASSGWLTTALARMQRRLQPPDVLTVHWYPGTRSPDLLTYMQGVLRQTGTRETWLSETGKKSVDDLDQENGLLEIVAAFNRRPSSQWAKLFVYRLAGGDSTDPDAPYQLLRPDTLMSPRPSFDAYRAHMYRMRTVTLQSADGQYVSAENNGGSAVHANRTSAGGWETFELDDLNGGSVQAGDLVRIKTSAGAAFAVNKWTRAVDATDWCGCDDAGLFLVAPVESSSPGDRARVALRSYLNGQFVSVDRGHVIANRSSIGPSETFQLVVH